MNNKRPAGEQFILFLLLSFGAMLIFQKFMAPKPKPVGPAKPAMTLAQAFVGIDAKVGPVLNATQAQAEYDKLQQEIKGNNEDEYSFWARLRSGLLQEYILSPQKPEVAIDSFAEVRDHNKGDDIQAQAIYQLSDIEFRQSWKQDGNPSQQAAKDLERIHGGRGGSQFNKTQIYVPQNDDGKSLWSGPPAAGFMLAPVLALPGMQSVTARLNECYKTTFLYKLFDWMVNLLGARPAYSYGLAIIAFAFLTRLAMQPLTKKQYDSMKGMQAIAPEMKKIQERYKDKKDPQAQQQLMKETREMYSKHGVNPALGCGLVAIQMPIFFIFVSPLIQHYTPKIEMVGASFLWVHNLAAPDFIWLILYAVSMFLSMRLSSSPPTDDTQRQTQMMMTMIMPFVFPFMLKGWPSAFIMYWMVYSLASTVFQWRMLKHADPSKSIVKSLFDTGAAPAADTKKDGKTIDAKAIGMTTSTSTSKNTTSKNGAVPPRPKKEESSSKAEKNGSAAAKNGSAPRTNDDEANDDEEADDEAPLTNVTGPGTATQRNNQRNRRRRRH